MKTIWPAVVGFFVGAVLGIIASWTLKDTTLGQGMFYVSGICCVLMTMMMAALILCTVLNRPQR